MYWDSIKLHALIASNEEVTGPVLDCETDVNSTQPSNHFFDNHSHKSLLTDL